LCHSRTDDQAALSSAADVHVYRLALRLTGDRRAAGWALLLQLSNWFGLYCMPRTLSSSFEAVLFAAAASHWAAVYQHMQQAQAKAEGLPRRLPPRCNPQLTRLPTALHGHL
jgi:hypothetical protein